MKKTLCYITLITIIIFVLSGCEFFLKNQSPQEIYENEKIKIKEIATEESSVDKVSEIIGELTLEEKIYQMMFVTPESLTGVDVVVQAGETSQEAIKNKPVGGIIYFGQNLVEREQTVQMIKNMQGYSKIPLFISVDEEGGLVSRLGSNPLMETTKHPPMAEIGATKEPDKAYKVGEVLANDLKAIGFNVDFAPVADVIVSENNVETGNRSFGNDAENVALMVENLVKGLDENGVSATLKHFPGAGATTTDSHNGFSDNPRTIEELRSVEFLPFISGINAGADFVMISHMTLTNATEEKLPCSMSEEVIQGMLIDELGFEGIVITDSLQMGAITEHYSPAEIGVMAVKAGNDMILMPQDLAATYKGIEDAVKSGEISEERIDESVKKIIKLKIEKGFWK